MPARFLLDTNIVSYLLREQAPHLKAHFMATPIESMTVSSITEAELRYGIAKRPGSAKLGLAVDRFLAGVSVSPWDSAAAAVYGPLRAAQERKGRPLSVEDLMIAAHVLSLGLVLVTSDQAFAFIEGLRTENWALS